MIDKDKGRDAQWRVELRDKMNARERSMRPRVEMPEQPAEVRRHNNLEVNIGLTAEMAQGEATRCLDCAEPGCVQGCPVGIDIPGFIKNIERGRTDEAVKVLKATSALPAVCGRVCPQEKQCESRCVYNKMKKQPVAIGYLERFAADSALGNDAEPTQPEPGNGIKIAVAGSGPAGLSFAGEMVSQGFDVTVFEALHATGGVLRYGIPEFRLPNSVVDAEIESLKLRGVTFVTDCIIGKTLSADDLAEMGFSGVFIGSGAGLPRFMNIPGENLINVMSCNEYLTRVNLMGAGRVGSDTPVAHGKRVAVIGGGNTAMDAARTAVRMGAEDVVIVYRRTAAEMPARVEEVRHAMQEGVRLLELHNPIEYTGDDKGRVTAMTLQRMELGEPDASGRRAPKPVEGATESYPVDMVIVSVGVSPNPIIPENFEGLDISRRGTIVVDESTMKSSLPGYYAGGDIVRGGATVILAMGDGRRAARVMAAELSGKKQ